MHSEWDWKGEDYPMDATLDMEMRFSVIGFGMIKTEKSLEVGMWFLMSVVYIRMGEVHNLML